MFDRLARLADRRHRLVLAVAALAVVAAGAFGGPVATRLSSASTNFEDSQSESALARKQLEEATGVAPGIALVALVETPQGAERATARRLREVAATIARDPAVAHVYSLLDTHDRSFLSRDGSEAYLAVAFRPVPPEDEADVAKRIEARFAGQPDVKLGGGLIAGTQVGLQIESDLARAELIALPLLFLLSLLIFRGLVAALLPVAGGIVSVLTTFAALRAVNTLTPLSVYAINLVTGIGLGLAIDYSLFIVSRYREELARSGPGPEALRRTLATAGRTVAFSSLTIAAAMAALLVFPQPFLYSMGLGGVFVALSSAVNALVVLPALLAALGMRVNALAPARMRRSAERSARAETTGFWYRLSQWVMRHAVFTAVASAAVMLALGIPFLGVKFTGVDASVLPESRSARQVDDALKTRFPADRSSPIYVAVKAPADAGAALGQYASMLRGRTHALVRAPQRVGPDTWRIDITSPDRPLSAVTKQIVGDTRSVAAPYPTRVGGQTATFLDLQSSLRSRIPLAVAVLALTSFVLLFLLTGSVILPLKSLVMAALTLSATLGILVFVFQNGRLEGLFHYTSQGALESTQPILLAAIAFGLSTDYSVFLLARIKEARDAGLSNTEAVARGLERTGRLVTAAALLFCVAVGAFSISKIVFIKELGVGMAVAVILDATFVRALLVPSLMKLLGDWNWWAPRPLRRVYERFGFSDA
jgi:RND superfamily putative drug exporter